MPDKKKSGLETLTFYRRLFFLLYLATILFTVAIELVFVSTGKLTWSSFFLGLGGYTVAIAAIIITSYVMVLKAIARSEMDNTKLKKSEEQYRTLVEFSPDAIAIHRDGHVVYCNDSTLKLLGMAGRDSIIGKPVMDFIDTEYRDLVRGRLDKVARQEDAPLVEERFLRLDGTRVDVEVAGTGIEYEGKPAVLIIARDITERKAAEKLLGSQRDLAIRLSMTENLTETLSLSIQAVLDLTGLDCGAVYLFDEETGDLEMVYHQGISGEFVEVTSLYRPESPNAAIVKEGVPRYVTFDELDIPRTAPEVEEGLKAGAVLPLKDAGRVIGCVNVFSHTMEEIPEASREIMVVLIGQIGQLISRSRLYSELRESEERYRLIAENMADVIWIMDLEFNRIYTSPSVERLRGFTPEEVRGMKPDEIATPESLENALKMLASELEIEKRGGANPDRSREFEVEQYRKDGSTVWTGVTARFLRDADGKPVGILGVGRDINDRKHDEEELKRANTELDGFARTVSHDLQGPLTAIRLANDILSELLDEPQTESVREDSRQTVETIGRNINASNRLIKDLLALARAGQVPNEVSSVDVSEVVARVLDENAGGIEDGGVDVTVSDDLGRITANPTHVYQVFSNLIGNAIRHNDGPNPRVEVTLPGTEGGKRRYLVKDNGSGIPPGDIDRIFTPFFKGKDGETGIGLATVDKIVRANNWEIHAYNDNGACFELVVNPPRTPTTT